MKQTLFFILKIMLLTSMIHSERWIDLPEIAKPTWLRCNNGRIYISDQHSIRIYDMVTRKQIKIIGKRGEGPKEFRSFPKITFNTGGDVIFYDTFKLIRYTKDLKYSNEKTIRFFCDRLHPTRNNFVLEKNNYINDRDKKKYRYFALFDHRLVQVRNLIKVPEEKDENQFLINPYPRARTSANLIFVSRPDRGFYFDVFDDRGKHLYHIEKKINKIESTEKHRQHQLEEIRYFIGKKIFDRAKSSGIFNKPLRKYMPAMKNFWLFDNKLYVKTYDSTGSTEKYIVLDFKGNMLYELRLPKVYREIQCFYNHRFIYLEETKIRNTGSCIG